MIVFLMLFVMACTPGGNGPTGNQSFNEIFVANQSDGSVMVFDRTADGTAIPLRTITGVYDPHGITLGP
jgi:hypothetical protein